VYTEITRPCIGRAREVYTAVTRPCTGSSIHGRLRPCIWRLHGPVTRPYNGRAVYTARTRPCMGRTHGPTTPPVYMTVYEPFVRTSSAMYMARTRPRTRDVYTAMYGPCTRPCTRHVYGRVHVPMCLRVQGPCTRPCTGHAHGRKRPSTRSYTAVYKGRLGRVYGR